VSAAPQVKPLSDAVAAVALRAYARHPMTRPLTLLSLALMLASSAAHAQLAPAACLPGSDQGNGLELAVTPLGRAHLVHVDRIQGALLHTEWDVGAAPVTSVVAPNVSIFAFSEVEDTGQAFDATGEPSVCFYDAVRSELRLATRLRGQWSLETVLAGAGAGDSCDLRFDNAGTAYVAFHHEGRLKLAIRALGAAWQVSVADEVAGRDVGVDPSLRLTADGRVVVAHGDRTQGELRVSTRAAQGAWSTASSALGGLRVGVSPRLMLDGADQLFVAHGAAPGNAQTSDAGLVTTTGRVGGALQSVRVQQDFVGGSVGADGRDGAFQVAARGLQRSALFGSEDSLRLFEGLPNDSSSTAIETWSSNSPRHLFQNVTLALGPGGEPLIAYLVDVAPSFGSAGGAFVCLTRPLDTDADRLPDATERRLGSDPRRADSDGDGRSDGMQWLLDGDPPTAAPASDAGVPEPDAGVPEPDAARPEPDAARLEPDAARPEPDAAPTRDAQVDATLAAPDVALTEPDAGVSELDAASLPDVQTDAAIAAPDAERDAQVDASAAATRDAAADDAATRVDEGTPDAFTGGVPPPPAVKTQPGSGCALQRTPRAGLGGAIALALTILALQAARRNRGPRKSRNARVS